MKKLIGLMLLILLLNGCDDGNLKVDTINFDAVAALKCSNNYIIYKLNGKELLVLDIPEAENAFIEEVGVKTFQISVSNRVRYRLYNGSASAANICETLQPATPTIAEEWTATSGTIQITSTAIYSNPDPVTGALKILKYNHHIVFLNVIFAKPTGNQGYDTFVFGDYLQAATTLAFDFPAANLAVCPSSSKIYSVSNARTESLVIENLNANLIPNSIGITTQTISNASNKLVYRLYQSTIQLPLSDYFCGTSTPINPFISQEWTAQDGVANVSGIIEVNTTTNGSGFLHTITLKKVTFQKGTGTTFYYGDSILYGVLLTN